MAKSKSRKSSKKHHLLSEQIRRMSKSQPDLSCKLNNQNYLNDIVQNLLNELNQNGDKVNEYSNDKNNLLKQLQNEMNQINELVKNPVLKRYFDIIFQLERCQQKIEQHNLERSDIMTEMYMTQQIILNMVQIKKFSPTTASLVRSLKENLMKFNEKLENTTTENEAAAVTGKQAGILAIKNFISILRNSSSINADKFKHHKNCSINCKTKVNEEIKDETDKKFLSPKISRMARIVDELQLKTKSLDPYVETVQRMKAKLSALRKHRKINENFIGETTNEISTLRDQLKKFYQEHDKEMLANKHLLDEYFQYRIRTNNIQAKINVLEELIREHRQHYRDTMDRIRILNYNLHQNRNDLKNN